MALSYGRKCFREKLTRYKVRVPILNNGTIDEDIIEKIVKSIPYWRGVKEAFLKARENNPKESSLDCMIAGNACIKYITDYNAVNMFQWKLTRAGQMQEQQRMFEKH